MYLRENSSNKIELVLVTEHAGQEEKEERYFIVDKLNAASMLSFLATQNYNNITKQEMEKLNGNTPRQEKKNISRFF